MKRYGCNYGHAATTIHLLPWAVDTERVEFGCADKTCGHHDPGGYWFEIERWFTGPPDFNDRRRPYTMRLHLLDTKGVWPAKLVDAFLAGGDQAVLELVELRREIEADTRRQVEREALPKPERTFRLMSIEDLAAEADAEPPSNRPPWALRCGPSFVRATDIRSRRARSRCEPWTRR
jgi:hypothetical protein